MASDALRRELRSDEPTSEWKAATRVAFRFFVVYLTLYAAATQILGGLLLVPEFSLPALGTQWPMRDITTWWADRVLRVSSPLTTTGNSGDTAFYWVQTFWLLLLALVVTLCWSEFAGRREYRTLHRWFRVFVRFALAGQMFYYGMAKVIPTQFPAPSLVTLLQPAGTLSLDDMLWTFVGSSMPYQIATGLAEVLAGALLVIPVTATLGALVGLGAMTQVFLLNMTYDFGLKQLSFHLIVMALFLLAPDARRLANVLLFNRPAGVATTGPALFTSARANRIALGAQIAFGAYLLVMFGNLSLGYWYANGGGRPRSPLYGIWDVERLSIDGEVRAPEQHAYDHQWRRLVFDTPDVVAIQRSDDSFAHLDAAIDPARRRLTLTRGASGVWTSVFSVERQADDRLSLRGQMDGRQFDVRLRRLDLDRFRLLNSRFRWIRPPGPFAG